MKAAVVCAVLAAVCVGVCLSQRLQLPKITDEERKFIVANMDVAVDCLIKPSKACPSYTDDVRRVLPDLMRNNFKCNCDTQRDVDMFRAELTRSKNSRALRRLTLWVNKQQFA